MPLGPSMAAVRWEVSPGSSGTAGPEGGRAETPALRCRAARMLAWGFSSQGVRLAVPRRSWGCSRGWVTLTGFASVSPFFVLVSVLGAERGLGFGGCALRNTPLCGLAGCTSLGAPGSESDLCRGPPGES